MPVIRLCFLWHMHQPFYKNLMTGEYRLPWVRLHALKDYYGMVKLLDEFPGVQQTFNLVPSLLVQVDDYVSGRANDPFYEVIAKPAADLSLPERNFAARYLFQANETNLIRRYPRYAQLLEEVQGTKGDVERVASRWTNQDFADLQVLSQLAWFDEYWIDSDQQVKALVAKGRNFDADDQRIMLEKQREILAAIIPAYANAAKKGTVEISTTPFYHPILPLVCDTNIGRVSAPEIALPNHRFSRPNDAREQLHRALDLSEKLFGVRPSGVWPSEGSVSNEVFDIASSLGVHWMATDEGVLGRSINSYFVRDKDGKLHPDCARDLYRPYVYENEDREVRLVFRDHSLSDLIGFVYAGVPPKDAAAHFVNQLKISASPVLASGRDAVVSVILDGENAWEHFPQSGREFLRRLYESFEKDGQIQVQSVHAALEHCKPEDFGQLNHVIPGSWINSNLNVWIGAPEDNRAWDLLAEARQTYDAHCVRASADQRALAYEELLIAEGSDWNWWYGPEHHTANDADFDELYRDHLANVYRALDVEVPADLSRPIITQAGEQIVTPQNQYIRPSMRGSSVSYFDWLGAATIRSSAQGAMHTAQQRLQTMFAGVDERFLFARLDFIGATVPGYGECVLSVESGSPNVVRTHVHVLIENGEVKRWWLTRPKVGENDRSVLSVDDFEEIAARVTRVLEVRVQRSAVGLTENSAARLRFTWFEGGVPVEALPRDGWMPLVLPEEEVLRESSQSAW